MMCIHIHFQEKKYFHKKTAEITRFDGTYLIFQWWKTSPRQVWIRIRIWPRSNHQTSVRKEKIRYLPTYLPNYLRIQMVIFRKVGVLKCAVV